MDKNVAEVAVAEVAAVETKASKKENRYTILAAEIKRLAKERKTKKAEMLAGIKKLEAEYRDYVKSVYKPGKKAAFDLFAKSRVLKLRTKEEIAAARAAEAAKKEARAKAKAEKLAAKKEADAKKAEAKAAKAAKKAAAKSETKAEPKVKAPKAKKQTPRKPLTKAECDAGIKCGLEAIDRAKAKVAAVKKAPAKPKAKAAPKAEVNEAAK